MSRDHRQKREPNAVMLARQQAELDRVWNDAKQRRGCATAMHRYPQYMRRIRETREAEASLDLDHLIH